MLPAAPGYNAFIVVFLPKSGWPFPIIEQQILHPESSSKNIRNYWMLFGQGILTRPQKPPAATYKNLKP